MSDSEHSTITYTSISSDDGSLDVGSPGVIVLGYDGLPMMPEDLYAYVEAVMQDPPPPDFVPEPVYPEFMPPEDDVLPAEEQPLPAAVSPTADSPGCITESDPEKDPEEEDDEDPEEDPADYPTDRDDDEEEEEESSGDDAYDEEEDKDEEEEEHLALVDSVPPPAYRTTSRMSIRAQTPIPFPSEAEGDRLLAIPTPPSSPLTSLSSPLPRIPSPPFPVPSLLPASPTHPLGYRAGMIRLRAESPSTSHLLPLPPPIVLPHTRASMVMMRATAPSTYILAPRSKTPPLGTPPLLPIPLPTSSLYLLLPSTDCRSDVPEVMLPPWKRLCIALGPRYEIGECSSAPTARPTGGFRAEYGFVGTLDAEIRRDLDREIGYGITDIWVDPDEIAEEIPATDVAELGQRMTDFVTTVRDIRFHACTARLMESEARISHEAWAQAMDASDTTRSETQMVALQSQQRPARDPAHPDVLEEAGSMADALAEHEIQRKNNLNGDGSQGSKSGITRPVRPTRECTYTDFLKCQPMNFKGTEGVVGLTQWFERMETVFNISNCAVENQVKFATCTLHGVALTWWKSYVKIVGQDAAYSIPWNTLMKMMTTKYFPRNEIKKLEIEIWELKSDKIEKYVGGLPDMIHGSVMASKPKTMQDAIEFATELMDKKIRTFAERQIENKRKQDDN
ncbi:putative reverse transcriptase domain-containing protein [Tanacetum coccineum]